LSAIQTEPMRSRGGLVVTVRPSLPLHEMLRDAITARRSSASSILTLTLLWTSLVGNGCRVGTQVTGMVSETKDTLEIATSLAATPSGWFGRMARRSVMQAVRKSRSARDRSKGKSNRSIRNGAIAMEIGVGEIHQQAAPDQRALEIAQNALKSAGFPALEMQVLRRDDGASWSFTFLPRGRVRGGGAEVVISKRDLSVVKILYLQ
jgi:hypothetical protein